MRLRDLWADPPDLLTHREVINLISCLPPEAVTLRLVFGDNAPWSDEMHRLTDIADLLDRANWQRSARPGSRPPTKSKFPRPQPYGADGRPGGEPDDDEDLDETDDAPDGAPDGVPGGSEDTDHGDAAAGAHITHGQERPDDGPDEWPSDDDG